MDIFYQSLFYEQTKQRGVGVLLDAIKSKKSVAGAAQLLLRVLWVAHCCIWVLGKIPSWKGLSGPWHRLPKEVVESLFLKVIKKHIDVTFADSA